MCGNGVFYRRRFVGTRGLRTCVVFAPPCGHHPAGMKFGLVCLYLYIIESAKTDKHWWRHCPVTHQIGKRKKLVGKFARFARQSIKHMRIVSRGNIEGTKKHMHHEHRNLSGRRSKH